MTTTPTPTQPATDEDIADIKRRAETPNPRTGMPVGLHNYHAMVAPFIARIEAESKSNAELRAEVERLKAMPSISAAIDFTHRVEDQLSACERREIDLLAEVSLLKQAADIADAIIEDGDATRTIRALRSRLSRVEEAAKKAGGVLKALEWSKPDYAEGGINFGPGCPSCGGHKHGSGYTHHEPGGHRKNCSLNSALESILSESGGVKS
jgi:hypothetical protein